VATTSGRRTSGTVVVDGDDFLGLLVDLHHHWLRVPEVAVGGGDAVLVGVHRPVVERRRVVLGAPGDVAGDRRRLVVAERSSIGWYFSSRSCS